MQCFWLGFSQGVFAVHYTPPFFLSLCFLSPTISLSNDGNVNETETWGLRESITEKDKDFPLNLKLVMHCYCLILQSEHRYYLYSRVDNQSFVIQPEVKLYP